MLLVEGRRGMVVAVGLGEARLQVVGMELVLVLLLERLYCSMGYIDARIKIAKS